MPKHTSDQIRTNLSQFMGSTVCFRHPIWRSLVYTEGVKYLAEHAEAWWLIDAIASHQRKALKDPMLREMQFWRLVFDFRTGEWDLICERDEGDIAFTQHIEYSDFPLPEGISIWVGRGGPNQWVLMLPTEY
jgi:hypothetical protein